MQNISHRFITCNNCSHFEHTEHPRLGHCAKGEQEDIAGLWDSDARYCETYSLRDNER